MLSVTDQSNRAFFSAIQTTLLEAKSPHNKTAIRPHFIVVSHIVADVVHFFEALSTIGTVQAVIPKRKSIDPQVLRQLQQSGYPIDDVGREGLQGARLDILFASNERFIIIDVGGYFAKMLPEGIVQKIHGIVECTENGHQRYEKLLQHTSLPYPVVSIARSPLKAMEDDLIGHSLGFYTEMLLRQQAVALRPLTIGVVGYGKIGKSICAYLLAQHHQPLVFDVSALAMVNAYKDGCVPTERSDILQKSDLLFCATGCQSLTDNDLPLLKDDAYISSATSADDEFSFSETTPGLVFLPPKNHIQEVKLGQKRFFLLNSGHSTNFTVPGDRVGYFIRLIQGEVIAAAYELLAKKLPAHQQIHCVSIKCQEKIAQLFLEIFVTKNNR